MATLRLSLIAALALLPAWYSSAQESKPAENPFSVSPEKNADGMKPDPKRDSVEFAFDGGTLRCTFGTTERGTKPHIAMIVVPSSVDALAKRAAIPIKQDGSGSVVIVSGPDGKFTQLTEASLDAWAKARNSNMSAREASVAENAFVAAVVHSLSTATPLQLWASLANE